MAGKIAGSTFSTGPKDDVAVVDVYKTQDSTPKNNAVSSSATKLATSAADAVRENAKLSTLGKLVDFDLKAKTVTLDKEGAMDKLKSLTGGLQSQVTDLKGAVAESVLGAVGFKDPKAAFAAISKGGVPGEIANQQIVGKLSYTDAKFVVGEVENIRKMDVSTAQGVATLLNSVSGNSKLASVLDMDAQFKILNNTVAWLTYLRVPEAIDAVVNRLKTDKEKKQLLLSNLRDAVMQSDLYTVNKTIDMAGSVACLKQLPNICQLILMFYKLPEGKASADSAALTQLVTLLNRLDNRWDEYNRNGTWVYNLELFTYASPDALDVLALEPNYLVPRMLANSYPSVDMIQLAQEMYEYLPLEPTR